MPGEVIDQFVILHKGWESENHCWITDDGRVFATSSGGPPYEMSPAEIDRHIPNAQASLDGLNRARAAIIARADPSPQNPA